MDNTGQIHEDNFTFRKENLTEKGKESILEKRIVCEKYEFNKYELLTEKCLNIHNELYHGNQQYGEVKNKHKREGDRKILDKYNLLCLNKKKEETN